MIDAFLNGNIDSDSQLNEKFRALSSTQRCVIMAIRNPHDFVLKPQKEGGGNNYYDDEAKDLLMKFVSPSTDTEFKEGLK